MGKEESIVRYLFTWAWNQHKCETEAAENNLFYVKEDVSVKTHL